MVGLLIVAILLGAGYEVLRLRASTNPHGVPTSPFTKTVTSTASPSNSASSSPGNQPHRGPTKPAAVVTGYYNAVNDHNYRKAWRLNYHVHSLETYQQFKAGFVGTEYTTLTIVSVSGDAVNIRLAATQTDGTVKYYAGTYTVQHGTIVDSAIQQTG